MISIIRGNNTWTWRGLAAVELPSLGTASFLLIHQTHFPLGKCNFFRPPKSCIFLTENVSEKSAVLFDVRHILIWTAHPSGLLNRKLNLHHIFGRYKMLNSNTSLCKMGPKQGKMATKIWKINQSSYGFIYVT